MLDELLPFELDEVVVAVRDTAPEEETELPKMALDDMFVVAERQKETNLWNERVAAAVPGFASGLFVQTANCS
jgi:hypothetical protein